MRSGSCAEICASHEAMEHFEFNIIGGWVGEFTPMFVVVADGKKIRDEGIYF